MSKIKKFPCGNEEIICEIDDVEKVINIRTIIEGTPVSFNVVEGVDEVFNILTEEHIPELHEMLYDIYLAKLG